MQPFCLNAWVSQYTDATLPLSHPNPIWIDQVVVDSRRVTSKNCLFVALKGPKSDGHSYLRDVAQHGARYAIVQKGFIRPSSLPDTLTLFYVEDPLRALQQIARLYREQLPAKIIAVTGSRGKTLMKDLLVHLLNPLGPVYGSPESFNSQVGVALSLLRIQKQHTLAVIEAGISKQGEMQHLADMLQPSSALLLNLMPQLGEPLETLETLAEEKMHLLTSVSEQGAVFLPALPCLKRYNPMLRAQRHTWDGGALRVTPTANPGEYAITSSSNRAVIKLPAGFWAQLLEQALYVAQHLGVSEKPLLEQLKSFKPESMHTLIWRTTQGVTLINSPYCADPQSIHLSMQHLRQAPPGSRRFFFLHGVRAPYDQQVTYAYLQQALNRKEVDQVVLCGLEEVKELRCGITYVQDVEAGLQLLAKETRHGDHIACKGSEQLSVELLTRVFQDRTPYNTCHIDMERMRHNIALMRKKLPSNTEIMVMVKALAYGTESVRMAHFLKEAGIDFLGVSFVDEAVALKQAGVTQTLFSLYVDPNEVEKAVHFDVHVGIDSLAMLQALERQAHVQGKKVAVHLHVDTGMRRLGCVAAEAVALAEEIARSEHIVFEGLFSHFVAADLAEEDSYTEQQFTTLSSIYQTLQAQGIAPKYLHMGNTAALGRLPHLTGNMVRIGLALYGLCEGGQEALSLHSSIIALHKCAKGESVGYGRRYKASKEETIAVVPLGYFDGISRQWTGKVFLQVRGVRVPIIAVCMDYLMLDVTAVVGAEVGDSVLVLGEDGHGNKQDFKLLAQEGGEILHALLAQIGPRISRIFLWNA